MSGTNDPGQEDLKRCSKCGQYLPHRAFAANRSRSDGLQYWCRACGAEAYRKKQIAKGKKPRPKVEVPPGHKFCPRCEQVKPHVEWSRSKHQAGGFQAYCKACIKVRGRRHYFRRTYGLEPDEVERMHAEQDGKCKICRRDLDLDSAHLDHDHATGAIRGLLCQCCNQGLGLFFDDASLLRRAATYVEGGSCISVTIGLDGEIRLAA